MMKYLSAFLLAAYLLCPIHVYAKEQIILDAEDDWAPYSSNIKDSAQGFAVNVNKAIFQAVGVDVKFKVVSYAQCLSDILKNTEVVGCFNTAKSAANESHFYWPHEPLFQASVFIWVPADSRLKGLSYKDLIGQKVGTTDGYEYGAAFDSSREVEKKVFESDKDLFKNLAQKKIDYAVVYADPAYLALKSLPKESNLVKSVGTLNKLDLYVSFSKMNPKSLHFLKLYNKGMDIIKKNGTYNKLKTKFIISLK